MRVGFRPLSTIVALVVLSLGALSLVGCGEDESSDPSLSVLDLDVVDDDAPAADGQGSTGDTVLALDTCEASCVDKECGGDGCGGSCGECGDGTSCSDGVCIPDEGCADVPFEGVCKGEVVVWCENDAVFSYDCASRDKVCAWDAQGGFNTCKTPSCEPSCGSNECGDDGCGGSCGDCPLGWSCVDGQCTDSCVPSCGGMECGDDGCGGSCGTCSVGTCVAGACTCVADCAGKECGPDGCGGSCGECPDATICGADRVCVDAGECGSIPGTGVCVGATLFACVDGDVQETTCDAPGQSCGYDATLFGGLGGYGCLSVACTPSCDGKECGDDGCGGQCGDCGPFLTCADTVCAFDGQTCAEVGSSGICEGTMLVACADGSLQVTLCELDGLECGWSDQVSANACIEPVQCFPQCAGKECGDDGCGGTCGTCSVDEVCSDGGSCLHQGGQCGDVEYVGECHDNLLVYCSSNGNLVINDCSKDGEVCGWDPSGNNGNGWFDCIDAPIGACGDVPAEGVCEGTLLLTCVAGEVVQEDCADQDKVCQWVQWQGEAQCSYDFGGDCGTITEAGKCDGNYHIFCNDGHLWAENCALFGGTCQYLPAQDSYDCAQ